MVKASAPLSPSRVQNVCRVECRTQSQRNSISFAILWNSREAYIRPSLFPRFSVQTYSEEETGPYVCFPAVPQNSERNGITLGLCPALHSAYVLHTARGKWGRCLHHQTTGRSCQHLDKSTLCPPHTKTHGGCYWGSGGVYKGKSLMNPLHFPSTFSTDTGVTCLESTCKS